MKKYYVDLELAKELRKNGFPQDHQHFWIEIKGVVSYVSSKNSFNEFHGISDRAIDFIDAPLSEEILEQLPQNIAEYELFIERLEGKFHVDYIRHLIYGDGVEYLHEEIDTKLSNALAKMWLYLVQIKNKFPKLIL